MGDIIKLEVGEDQRKIRKILHYTGLPCDARTITEAVLKMEATVEYPEPLLLVRADPPSARVPALPGAAARPEARVED
jgi:hypothetical protein